jgi:hypothetical protein
MKKQYLKKNLNIYITKKLVLNYPFSIFTINYEKKNLVQCVKIKSLTKVSFFHVFKSLKRNLFFPPFRSVHFDNLMNLNVFFFRNSQFQKNTKTFFRIRLNNFFLTDLTLIKTFFFKMQGIIIRLRFLLANFFMKFYFFKKFGDNFHFVKKN